MIRNPGASSFPKPVQDEAVYSKVGEPAKWTEGEEQNGQAAGNTYILWGPYEANQYDGESTVKKQYSRLTD